MGRDFAINPQNLQLSSSSVHNQKNAAKQKEQNKLQSLITDLRFTDTGDSKPNKLTLTAGAINFQVSIKNDPRSSLALANKQSEKSAAAALLANAGVTPESVEELKAAGVTDVTMTAGGEIKSLKLQNLKIDQPLAQQVFNAIAKNGKNMGAILNSLSTKSPEKALKLLSGLFGNTNIRENNPDYKKAGKTAVVDLITTKLLEGLQKLNTNAEVYKILSKIFLEDSVIEKMIEAWEEKRLEDRAKFEEYLKETTLMKIVDENEKEASAKKMLQMAIVVGDISKIKEAATVLHACGMSSSDIKLLIENIDVDDLLKDTDLKEPDGPGKDLVGGQKYAAKAKSQELVSIKGQVKSIKDIMLELNAQRGGLKIEQA